MKIWLSSKYETQQDNHWNDFEKFKLSSEFKTRIKIITKIIMEDSLHIRKHAINTTMHVHRMLWISNINGHGANINSNKHNTHAHTPPKVKSRCKMAMVLRRKETYKDFATNVIIWTNFIFVLQKGAHIQVEKY